MSVETIAQEAEAITERPRQYGAIVQCPCGCSICFKKYAVVVLANCWQRAEEFARGMIEGAEYGQGNLIAVERDHVETVIDLGDGDDRAAAREFYNEQARRGRIIYVS